MVTKGILHPKYHAPVVQRSSILAFQAGDSGSNPGGGMKVGVKLPSFGLSLLFKERKVNLSMKEEHLTPHYERRLKLVLQRIDPINFGDIDRKRVKNNKVNPTFNLTQKNKELMLKYYRKMCNENIAPARKHNVLGVLSRLLEMLGKDFETATQDDIEQLVAQINTKNIGSVTRQDYLKKLRQLDKWNNGGKEWSDKTKWISTKLGKKHFKLPSQLITPDEAKQLIDATETVRDRALIHLMWESGARIGEIINLNMNSIEFNKGEARIRMRGKVGERQILLLESVHDLKEYCKTRNGAEPEDPLFIQFGTRYKGASLTHHGISKLLLKTKSQTEIKKRIYAYLFRHSRASYLASQGLNEAQMCMIFGWTVGSKQPATYIHLSGAQVEDAYKQLYGINQGQKRETMLKCEVCGEMNPSTIDTCNNCYNPLTIHGALKIKQEKEIIQQDRDISQQVFAQAVKLMSEKGVSVEDAQKEAIKMVAAQQIQTQKANG